MTLFQRIIQGKKPQILLLHGLYSSSSNWYMVAKGLGYKVRLVDLPNHGRTEWSDEFSYHSIAEAIKPLITEPTILLGHSFGGRVAMLLATECPEVLGLIVVDISPVASPKIDRAFTLCHAIFLQHLVAAKRIGVTDIETYLKEQGAAEDMTAAVDQAYRQMNIEVIADKIMQLPHEWYELSDKKGVTHKPTLFIRGGASPYITDTYIEEFPKYYSDFEVVTIKGATHRLHHEKPEEFIAVVRKFIEERWHE